MTEPILVVDFGTSGTAAALVLGAQVRLVKEPASGLARWPSSACLDDEGLLVATTAERRKRSAPRNYVDGPRRGVDADAAIWLGGREVSGADVLVGFLSAIKAEGERFYGGQLARATLTVPAGYHVPDARRDQMIAIGEQAGFRDVELVTDSVCAVLDPELGPPVVDGGLVLVCDLGATWSVALTQRRGDQIVQRAQRSSNGGLELDIQLINYLRAEGRDWLEPMLAAEGDAGLRAYYELVDFVRRLKHQLSYAEEVEDHLTAFAPSLRLTRGWVEKFAETALRGVVATGQAMLAEAEAGAGPDDIAVLVVGGCTRLPFVAPSIQGGLGRMVRSPADPELAVVRGAARWSMGAPARQVAVAASTRRVEPLAWDLPPGGARLLRWLVEEGETYDAGAVLAQIATVEDRVYDLTAVHEGTLLAHRIEPGATVEGVLVAAAKPAVWLADDPPAKVQELSAEGEWFLTPDLRMLVECAEAGRSVRLRDIAGGAVVGEFRPHFNGGRPAHARVFVQPDGRLALVAWDTEGRFTVWDIESGRLQASFHDSNGPHKVLVNEAQWRLTAEGEGKVSAGRYQRVVTNVWDMRTGTKVERLTDPDWQRHRTGFASRSAADGFAAAASSPDGRLRAVAVRPAGGGTALAVHDAATDKEVFRAEHPAREGVRAAFSADGRYLLANWESATRSQVDVWEI